MYDTFSQDYDRFVNWPERLSAELPFLEDVLHGLGRPLHVLDAACGTGMHAVALAQRGHTLTGADLSAGMIAQAQANATKHGLHISFAVAGFGQLAAAFGPAAFDAVLCLGNSLPHLLDTHSLTAAIQDFAACLRPGGLLILQNRNFDAVLAARQRWMEPQTHREGENEWLFLRFYDFAADGLIDFNILTLHRTADGWRQSVATTRLRPLLQIELRAALLAAGFEAPIWYGSLSHTAFDAANSPNLVGVARHS